MASYSDWYSWSQKGTGVRRVMWVCGKETVLVEEIIDFVRTSLAVNVMDYVTLFAGGHKPTDGAASDKEVWAAVNQYPFDPTSNRLVLIRDAQRVRRWAPLEAWMDQGRQMPTVYLLFISSIQDVYEHERNGRFKLDVQDKKILQSGPAIIVSKAMGALVECKTPTSEPKMKLNKRVGPSNLVAWAQRQLPVDVSLGRTSIMDEATAEHLLFRVGGDLAKARDVCLKARLFGGVPSTKLFDALCVESPGLGYVQYLLNRDKRKALIELESLPEDQYARIVGMLEMEIERLAKLNKGLRERKLLREVCSQYGWSEYQVKSRWDIAKHYDASKRLHCRKVLSATDEVLRDSPYGAVGVLEALTVLW